MPGCKPFLSPSPKAGGKKKKEKKKKQIFVDAMISNLRYLRFSLNQPIKSADDRYTGILKNIIRTYEYVIFSFPVRFNFPCNPIRCRLPDFDVIFITRFLKSNINYKLPQGQTTPPPKKKIWVCLCTPNFHLYITEIDIQQHNQLQCP